ncbi:MAG: DnaJ domain-containing protein, partial [Alphaproteobacteria bacterium]|nr:DnaJ domain-containing protein [Alphaproteobacteria bacterium]
MKRDVLGYYEALNADYYTDISVIKANYRELAKHWHPDINQSEEAVEKFQLISEAWDVISDESKREDYNLLSAVYEKQNYPDFDNIVPFADGVADIRAVKLEKVFGMGLKYKLNNKLEVCDYKQAVRINFKVAAQNWLLGWWNWTSFIKNISALQNNWKFPFSKPESLRVFIHNIVAYKKAGKINLAVASAVRALEFADGQLK